MIDDTVCTDCGHRWYGFDPLAEAEVIAEAEALTGGAE